MKIDDYHKLDDAPDQQNPIGVHTLYILDGKVKYCFTDDKGKGEQPLVDFAGHAAQVHAIKDATDQYLTDEGRIKSPRDGKVNPLATYRATLPQAGGRLKIKILYRLTKPHSTDWSLSYEIRGERPSGESLSTTTSLGESVSMSLHQTDGTLAVPATTGSSTSGVTASVAGGTIAPVRPRHDSETPPPTLDPARDGNRNLFPGHSSGGFSDMSYSLDYW